MPSEYKEKVSPTESTEGKLGSVSKTGLSDGGIRRMQMPQETSAACGSLERDQGLKLNKQIEGGVPEGYEGHHLIGIAEAKTSLAMQDAARHGYNINNGNNGIALPTEKAEAARTGLPVHNGRHVKEYTDRVSEHLNSLDGRYVRAAKAGKPWGEGRLVDNVHSMEDKIRQELAQGQLQLQTQESS